MDYAKTLESNSVKIQVGAALFLRSEGAKGYPHLPELLRCCQAIDLKKEFIDKYEDGLLGYGALSMGEVIHDYGFEASNPLHMQILDWLVETTHCQHLNVAANAIWGLGLLASNHDKAVRCLTLIIESDLRDNERHEISLRAIALRMLARIDRNLAIPYRSSNSWEELLRWNDNMQRNQISEYLCKELSWMYD